MSASGKNSKTCQQKSVEKPSSSSTSAPVKEPVCKKKGFFGWLKEKMYSEEELAAKLVEKREKEQQKQKGKQTTCKW